METIITIKRNALAKHLAVDNDNINIDESGVFTVSSGETQQRWLVLTDDEADARVRDEVLNSLWAFNVDFIAANTPTGLSAEAIDVLREMQRDRGESINDIVAAMIVDMDRFVRDSIITDGRGHFLSCDGDEVDLDGGFLGYRLD